MADEKGGGSRVAYAIAYLLLLTVSIYCLLKFHSCGKCLGFLHGTFVVLIAHGLLGSIKWTGREDSAKASTYLSYTAVFVPLLALPCLLAYALPIKLVGQKELARALLVSHFLPIAIYFVKSDAGEETVDLGVASSLFTLSCISMYYKDLYLFGATCMYALAHYGSKCRDFCPLEEELWHTYVLSPFAYLCLMFGLQC